MSFAVVWYNTDQSRTSQQSHESGELTARSCSVSEFMFSCRCAGDEGQMPQVHPSPQHSIPGIEPVAKAHLYCDLNFEGPHSQTGRLGVKFAWFAAKIHTEA
jgi:hypothetical protein